MRAVTMGASRSGAFRGQRCSLMSIRCKKLVSNDLERTGIRSISR